MSNPETSISERIRRATELAAGALGSAQAAKPAIKVQEKAKAKTQTGAQDMQEIEIAAETAVKLDIKNNPFYKTLTDTQTTQEEKIAAISDALNPKKQPMEKLRENYKAFQEYYTYLQSEELEEALENVQRLIKEIEGSTKVEIAGILKNLKGMLSDVNVSRQLIEVLRQSRITGQTIQQMSDAIDRNEAIIKDLAKLEETKKSVQEKADIAKEFVDKKIAEREAAESTFGARFLGALPFMRKDTTFSDRVTGAEAGYQAEQKRLQDIENRITTLQGERRADLENGPLTILRSVDEVDDNLSDRLISSGKNGIDTIREAQKSVLNLMGRALFSEGEVDKIARRVADKQVSLTVLQSGLQDASSHTNDFKTDLEDKGMTMEAELEIARAPQDGAVPSIAEIAKKKTAAIRNKTDLGEVIDYQGKLNDTIGEMEITLAKNIEKQGETDRQGKIIQGTKKSLMILGRDSLNTVAQNLEGVLHNLHADQTDETQAAVVEFARAAEEVKRGSMEGMITRQREMHEKDMTLLEDAIKRLNDSSTIIATTLEQTVDEGIERAEKHKKLQEATDQLEGATSAMRKVTGEISHAATLDGPSRPAAAVGAGGSGKPSLDRQ